MTHRELLDRVGPALRNQLLSMAPWVLSEIDRWCEGDFDGEVDPDYPCVFCKRPASATRILLGCSANIGPDGKVLGPKFTMVMPPDTPPFPLMVCDDCVRAYESLIEEDTMTGRKRPTPSEVLEQAANALRAEETPDAEALIAEMTRRFEMSHPREVKRGECSLCKRGHGKVVFGDGVQLCGDCLATARDDLRTGKKT